MAFKRALWHSGLTYQQQCPLCRTNVQYTDYHLDFRPWFPDGFVYCPTCKKPLRHNEAYALNPDGTTNRPQTVNPAPQQPQTAPAEGAKAFCTNCGKQYVPGTDHFCGGCGKKLD